MPIDAFSVLFAQLTRDLLAIAKFLFIFANASDDTKLVNKLKMSAFVKFYRNQRSWGILRSAQLASQYQETRQLCGCAAGRCGFVVTTDASCGNVAFLVSQSCIEQNRQQLAICLDAIFYKLPHLIHCWVLGDLCTSEHTRVVNDF